MRVSSRVIMMIISVIMQMRVTAVGYQIYPLRGVDHTQTAVAILQAQCERILPRKMTHLHIQYAAGGRFQRRQRRIEVFRIGIAGKQ